ncbi:uncharacterized protein [Melanerpes formicivorus]|uniref:uncharacterized protein isoform X2 n=1 Tax=Melanerpes formicivorus TaxID=211600 RepID=UPI00358FE5C5
MEQQLRPGGLVACNESFSSFSRRFLCQLLQLAPVKYLLKILQKASVWVGCEAPVEAILSRVLCSQHQEALKSFVLSIVLSIVPTRIQSILGYYLPAVWEQSTVPKEPQEAALEPGSRGNKRTREDVAEEERESWLLWLERDLSQESSDSEDATYEPSELETASEEYRSQNDTDLELQELLGGEELPAPQDEQEP